MRKMGTNSMIQESITGVARGVMTVATNRIDRCLLSVVAGMAVAALTAGCSAGQRGGASVVTTVPSGPGTTTGCFVPLCSRLELDSTTVRSGQDLSGRIIVVNNTGQAIKATGCGGIFRVLLTNSDPRTRKLAWPTCAELLVIPVGVSTTAIKAHAGYPQCSSATGDIPCTSSGAPPLPPGNYAATTFEMGNALPVPAPLAVTVTP